MQTLKLWALEHALGIILGPLALLIMQGLKHAVAWIEALPAWQKRAVVVAVSAVLTSLGHLLGVDFGVAGGESVSGLAELPKGTIEAALAAVIAMALHALKRAAKGGK